MCKKESDIWVGKRVVREKGSETEEVSQSDKWVVFIVQIKKKTGAIQFNIYNVYSEMGAHDVILYTFVYKIVLLHMLSVVAAISPPHKYKRKNIVNMWAHIIFSLFILLCRRTKLKTKNTKFVASFQLSALSLNALCPRFIHVHKLDFRFKWNWTTFGKENENEYDKWPFLIELFLIVSQLYTILYFRAIYQMLWIFPQLFVSLIFFLFEYEMSVYVYVLLNHLPIHIEHKIYISQSEWC